MSRSLFGTSKKQVPVETFCICTINSYVATVAVVRKFNDEGTLNLPLVLFSVSEKIQGETLGSVVQALHQILEQARSHGGNPTKIFCVVGEPWTLSIPRSVHLEKGNEFKVTQSVIDDALLRDMRAAESDMRREFPNFEDLMIFDIAEPIFSVNGYRVDRHVVGGMIPSLDVARSLSVIPKIVHDQLKLAIASVFHRDDITFVARSHVFARTVSEEKILNLSIGGVSTDWMYIDRGVISSSSSSQGGLYEIEHGIAHEFSISKKMIDSTMLFATDIGLVEHERDIYYKRTLRACESWLHDVRASFETLKKQVDNMPNVIVVSSDAPWIAALAPVIARELGSPVAVASDDLQPYAIVFAHDAQVKTSALAQAIEYCLASAN